MSEFGAYDAALWYVPYQEYINKPDTWKNFAIQDLSPVGQPQYYIDAKDRQSQQYVSVQRKVMSAVIEGGHTPTLTPEEQMVTLGKATDYVDKVTLDDYKDRADKFWGKDPGIMTGIGGETLPDVKDPIPPTTMTDPATVYNYYTTNNYYQTAPVPASASSGPGQSDSFSWLFPLMLIMMLTQNMQNQQQQPVVVRDSW